MTTADRTALKILIDRAVRKRLGGHKIGVERARGSTHDYDGIHGKSDWPRGCGLTKRQMINLKRQRVGV
jgi:hypothetical protein